MRKHAPPPTRFGASALVQGKTASTGAPQQHAPPVTKFGRATAQTMSASARPGMPPPTQFGGSMAGQTKSVAQHSMPLPPATKFGPTTAQPSRAQAFSRTRVLQRMVADELKGARSQRTRKPLLDESGHKLVRRIPFEAELISSMRVTRGNHRRHIVAQNVLLTHVEEYFSGGNGAAMSFGDIAGHMTAINLQIRNTAKNKSQLISELVRALNSNRANLFEDNGGENTSIGFLAPQVRSIRQQAEQCGSMNEISDLVLDLVPKLHVGFGFAREHTEYVVDVLNDIAENISAMTKDDVIELLDDVVFSLNTDLPKEEGDDRSGTALEVMTLLGDKNAAADPPYGDKFWKALDTFMHM